MSKIVFIQFILSSNDVSTVLNLCSTNKEINELCKNNKQIKKHIKKLEEPFIPCKDLINYIHQYCYEITKTEGNIKLFYKLIENILFCLENKKNIEKTIKLYKTKKFIKTLITKIEQENNFGNLDDKWYKKTMNRFNKLYDFIIIYK